MKTFAFLSVLLPAAAFGQSPAQPVGTRVAAILADGVQNGGQGLYLKQVNGPLMQCRTTGNLRPREYGGRSSRCSMRWRCPDRRLHAEHADHALSERAEQLSQPLATRRSGANHDRPTGDDVALRQCADARVPGGLPRRVSTRSHGTGSNLHGTAADSRLPDAGRTTPAEMAGGVGGDRLGNLPTFERRTFLGLLAGKAQALAESTDYEHIWDSDIPKMMRQEAPQGMTQAQMTQYQNSMDLQYKSGAAVLCRQLECTEATEDRSIVGWAKIPFCSGGLTVGREYIFGAMISGALERRGQRGKSRPHSWRSPRPRRIAARAASGRNGLVLRRRRRAGITGSELDLTGQTMVFRGRTPRMRRDTGWTSGRSRRALNWAPSLRREQTPSSPTCPVPAPMVYARLWTARTDQ